MIDGFQLAHLWDYAIEYLPEAQKVREHQNTLPLEYLFTEEGEFVDSKPYARQMWNVANKVIERKLGPAAAEITAACLLLALAGWELYEPYMFNLYKARSPNLTPENMPDALLPGIAHAVKNLNNVTGRNVQFVSPIAPFRDSVLDEPQTEGLDMVFIPHRQLMNNNSITTSNTESANIKHVSERLHKHLSHVEIVSLWIDTETHRNVMHHYRKTIHQAFWDGDAQYDEKLTQAIHDNHELKDKYLKAINQAVADGDLKAETSVSDSGVRNWKTILYSPTMLRTVQGDTGIHEGREVYVQHMINRDDFRAWLEKTHQWPISDDCLLAQWFEPEMQAEAIKIGGVSNQSLAEVAALAEYVHNGESIDWNYWAKLPNITPAYAARLAFHIDPIKWPDEARYKQGLLPDDLREKIKRLTLQLESRSSWSLIDLVSALGEDSAPFYMVQAVKDRAANGPASVKDELVSQADTTPNERNSQLHKLIWRVRLHLIRTKGKATAPQIWNEIRYRHTEHDTDGIIQEVTADLIQWVSFYGNEPKFHKNSLSATITKLKKNPPL